MNVIFVGPKDDFEHQREMEIIPRVGDIVTLRMSFSQDVLTCGIVEAVHWSIPAAVYPRPTITVLLGEVTHDHSHQSWRPGALSHGDGACPAEPQMAHRLSSAGGAGTAFPAVCEKEECK